MREGRCKISTHSNPQRSVFLQPKVGRLRLLPRADLRNSGSARRAPRGSALRESGIMDSSRFNRPRYWVLAVAILALTAAPAGIYLARRTPAVPSVAFSEFLRQIQANSVARVTFNERALEVVYKDGTHVQTI